MHFPEYNKPTNEVLKDLQNFMGFAQKHQDTDFVNSEFVWIMRLSQAHGVTGVRTWYEVARCFMFNDIAPEDIQAIALSSFLDQVDWEVVSTYLMSNYFVAKVVQNTQEAA